MTPNLGWIRWPGTVHIANLPFRRLPQLASDQIQRFKWTDGTAAKSSQEKLSSEMASMVQLLIKSNRKTETNKQKSNEISFKYIKCLKRFKWFERFK